MGRINQWETKTPQTNDKVLGLDTLDDEVLFNIEALVGYIRDQIVTVSDTAPTNPSVGDIWVDIS